MLRPTSREIAVEPPHTTLLFIDVQNFCATRTGGEFAGHTPEALSDFFGVMERRVVPNMQRLQAGCREAGIEVMYTVVQNLTRDGRDRSLDYKISGISVPPGSQGAQVIAAIAPGDDEIVLPKTSSNVFHSTNLDYLLRNLGTRYLVVSGILTDQCIDAAVRSACDLGYLVTLVTDACAAHSRERHEFTLRAIRGYCRQRTTDELLRELGRA